MSVAPESISTPPFVARLDAPAQVEPILAMFEDRWEEAAGERLSSSEFYDRYLRGEYDSPIGLAWATYYEAYIELSERARQLEQVMPPQALAVC